MCVVSYRKPIPLLNVHIKYAYFTCILDVCGFLPKTRSSLTNIMLEENICENKDM